MADQVVLAGFFITKAIWNLHTAPSLIDRILAGPVLRGLCTWSRLQEMPSEAMFCGPFPVHRDRPASMDAQGPHSSVRNRDSGRRKSRMIGP